MLVEAGVVRRIFTLLVLAGAGAALFGTLIWMLNVNLRSELHWLLPRKIEDVAHLCLMPLWLYLPILLFRFHRHLRRVGVSATL
jgi:hypothetical protein